LLCVHVNGRNRHAVALKVNMKGHGYRELQALKHIGNRKEKGDLKGSEYIMDLFDHFELTDKNGKHLVLVLEVMWMNLYNFIGGYSEDTEMRMAIQACGIIRNGNTSF
jgi:hypothetical protein